MKKQNLKSISDVVEFVSANGLGNSNGGTSDQVLRTTSAKPLWQSILRKRGLDETGPYRSSRRCHRFNVDTGGGYKHGDRCTFRHVRKNAFNGKRTRAGVRCFICSKNHHARSCPERPKIDEPSKEAGNEQARALTSQKIVQWNCVRFSLHSAHLQARIS